MSQQLPRRSLLDEVMRAYDVHEVHSLWAPAPPEAVYAAVQTVTGPEVRLLGPLMAVRTLPARLLGRRPLDGLASGQPLLDAFRDAGFAVLGERPGAEVVFGTVARFWRVLDAPLPAIRTREDFLAFDRPGYAKVATSFVVTAEDGGSRIVTETRVRGTSPDATRRFRWYWLVIRAGSGAIRRSWLHAIRRRARAGAGTRAATGAATAGLNSTDAYRDERVSIPARWIPRLITGVAVVHMVTGLVLWTPVRAFVDAGVINSIRSSGDPQRESALWYQLTGVALLALGELARWTVRETGRLPARTGGWLIAAGAVNVLFQPASGGWLVATIGAIALLAARNQAPGGAVAGMPVRAAAT